jgi:hypothetical protein
MKKTLSVFLALLMVLLSVAAYAEENPTVVTVNGDSITQAELNAMMSALDAQMTQYGIDTSSENVQNAIREAAMQELVEDRLLTQDMTAQGCYDMTEEEEASIADAAKKSQADLQQQMESYFASYMDSQEDSSATAAELAETYLKDSGYTLEYMENYIRNTVASTKYEQWLMEGEADTTQEEIQAAYEERVASSKAAYENDVSAFETALANNQEVWYRPDGYRAVLQIMLSAQGDDDAQKLASVKETTDAIYDRLEKGESFESLIAAYGEDSAFDDASFYETGYQVNPQSVLWEDAFVQAAFGDGMKHPGDYSQPVVFGDNVHILYYLRDIPGGAMELTDALAAALGQELYAQRTEEKMEARLATLKEEAEIVYEK